MDLEVVVDQEEAQTTMVSQQHTRQAPRYHQQAVRIRHISAAQLTRQSVTNLELPLTSSRSPRELFRDLQAYLMEESRHHPSP